MQVSAYLKLSIAVALATIALKFGAWWLTDSVGLLSDALESLVNLAGAVFALMMVTVAAQPPDERAHGAGGASGGTGGSSSASGGSSAICGLTGAGEMGGSTASHSARQSKGSRGGVGTLAAVTEGAGAARLSGAASIEA